MRYLKFNDLFSVTFAILAMVCCVVAQSQSQQLTDKDKKQILKAILNDAQSRFDANADLRNSFRNCQNLTLNNKRVIFLSTENIKRKFVPKIASIHFELMDKDQINAEVEANGQLCYLMVRGFTQNEGKIVVNLDRVVLTTGGCKGCLKGFYALSTSYECQKSKKWQVGYKSSGEIVN